MENLSKPSEILVAEELSSSVEYRLWMGILEPVTHRLIISTTWHQMSKKQNCKMSTRKSTGQRTAVFVLLPQELVIVHNFLPHWRLDSPNSVPAPWLLPRATRAQMTFRMSCLIPWLIKFKPSWLRKIEKLLVSRAIQPPKIAPLFYPSEISGLTQLQLKYLSTTKSKGGTNR